MKKTQLLVLLCLIALLCACGTEKELIEPSTSESGNISSLPNPVPDPVNFPSNDLFASDYQAGEENATGNLWTNRTLCRQGNYIYHFNEQDSCLEKWTVDEGIDNAQFICHVDTNMFAAKDGKDVARSNHLEIVGDYIYLCLKSGATVGSDSLTSIIRVRTDGNAQSILVTDCANCQFRIVNNTLFYLSVEYMQQDLSTEEYCIAIKTIDLTKLDATATDIEHVAMYVSGTLLIVDESVEGGHDPENLFVVEHDGKYVIGYEYFYSYYSGGNDYYSLRYDVIDANDAFSAVNFRKEHSNGYIRFPELNGQILVSNGYWGSSGTYAIDIDFWPDDMHDGQEITPDRQAVICVAEGMIIHTMPNDGFWMLNLSTGEDQKINNDSPSYVEYVGDGKIYYYVWSEGYEYNFCSCNLDGSEWTKIAVY